MKNRTNKYFEGYTSKNNQGDSFSIVEKVNHKEVYVVFDGYTQKIKTTAKDIARKSVRNPFKPSVYGVGFTGEVKTKDSNNKHFVSYIKWSEMIRRCYNPEYKRESWGDCEVSDDWLCYENFKSWYDNQEIKGEGYHLDKDILIKGNKLYSENTCCLVPQEINVLFTNRYNYRGDYPVGVTPRGNKFVARMSIYGNYVELGFANTPEESFYLYKKFKEDHIKLLADLYFKDGKITQRVKLALYSYTIDIAD